MRIQPDSDGTGNVVVTHPDGRQVRFGKNPDGSYAPPYGSFATLISVTGGGWKLTDKDQTSYVFDGGGLAVSFGRDGPVARSVNEARGRWPWVPRPGPPPR